LLANLLDMEAASRVQERLRQLGFFSGVGDGIWGPRSRIALLNFKAHSGLAVNDRWDLQTQTALLRGGTVAPLNYLPPEPGTPVRGLNMPFAPPPGASLHPLNPADAEVIQDRLRALGYYQFPAEGVWGLESRNALRQFKGANGLPADDVWDASTERILIRRRSVLNR
jgi:peptidoglycan hydrolase-like protein with peptidoglycan-binding domain